MDILFEGFRAIGSLFVNPIFYWVIILCFLPAFQRGELEKELFNQELSSTAAEVKNTFYLSLFMTVVLLVFIVGLKVTFSYELIAVLSVIIVLLSFRTNHIFLSASYTLGLSFLILWFIPKGYLDQALYPEQSFISLAVMIGIYLIGEAVLYFLFKDKEAFPRLAYSERGRWYGKLQVNKLSIIPFMVFLPTSNGAITNSLLPILTIGDQEYALFIMPFIIGFNHLFQGGLPEDYTKSLSYSVFGLGLLVLLMAMGGYINSHLALVAVVLAILGRILIHYLYYRKDKKQAPAFIEGHLEIRVLALLKNSPAEKLGFQRGDVILSVNEIVVESLEHFNQLLAEHAGDCLIEIHRSKGRLRYIQNYDYLGSYEELGLYFAEEPYMHSREYREAQLVEDDG